VQLICQQGQCGAIGLPEVRFNFIYSAIARDGYLSVLQNTIARHISILFLEEECYFEEDAATLHAQYEWGAIMPVIFP
jgi:hypothetical protein